VDFFRTFGLLGNYSKYLEKEHFMIRNFGLLDFWTFEKNILKSKNNGF
jgi:hypothetical protein